MFARFQVSSRAQPATFASYEDNPAYLGAVNRGCSIGPVAHKATEEKGATFKTLFSTSCRINHAEGGAGEVASASTQCFILSTIATSNDNFAVVNRRVKCYAFEVFSTICFTKPIFGFYFQHQVHVSCNSSSVVSNFCYLISAT